MKMDLPTLFLSISTSAFMAMGFEGPDGKKDPQVKNLELARQNIDLLELLKEKTKGNLTPDEGKLLDHLLFETRVKFVEAQKS